MKKNTSSNQSIGVQGGDVRKELFFGGIAIMLFLSGSFLQAATQESLESEYQRAMIVETTDRDLEKAISMYQEIANRSDVDAGWASKAHYQIGLCYERLGNVTEAMKAYEKAMSLGVDSAIEVTQKARASFVRLKSQLDQERQLHEAQALKPEEERPLPKGRRFRSARHYLNIVGVDYTFNPEYSGKGLGISLLGYEYIHPSGLAIKAVPLSFSYLDDVDHDNSHYVPIWLNYYFQGNPKKPWPFIGLGYDDYSIETRKTSDFVNGYEFAIDEGKGVALQAGLSLGNSLKSRNVVALKVLPLGKPIEQTTFSLSYDFQYSFQKER